MKSINLDKLLIKLALNTDLSSKIAKKVNNLVTFSSLGLHWYACHPRQAQITEHLHSRKQKLT